MKANQEKCILLLVGALDVRNAKVSVAPTTGRGSKSWRKGVIVRVGGECSGRSWFEAEGKSEDDAAEALVIALSVRAKSRSEELRAKERWAASEAEGVEACIRAASAEYEAAPATNDPKAST